MLSKCLCCCVGIKLNQVSVTITGEVNIPGVYKVDPFSTIIDAILIAGGIKKSGTLRNIKFLDYGVLVKDQKFEFHNNFAVIPFNLTFAYAVALALIGKAKKIYFAGFDGYEKNHRLFNEMQKTIEIILKNNKSLKLVSLTKTKYKFFRK